MTFKAYLAVKAAKGFYNWGEYAFTRFVEKHNVNQKLLHLALRLESEKRALKRFEKYGSLDGLI